MRCPQPGQLEAAKRRSAAPRLRIRRRSLAFCQIILLLWLCPSLSAEDSALSLEDCIELAMAAPSTATAAERGVDAAEEGRRVAKADLLPGVGARSGYNYTSPVTNGPNPFSFVANNGVREYLALAESSWELDLSGRLRAGLALARANRDLAAADARIARRDLRRAVAVAYYDLLFARRAEGLEEAALEQARQFERLTRTRQSQGESSMADVYKAVTQTASFEQRLSQARLDAQLANQVLASFWTADADIPVRLQDRLDNPTAPPDAVAARGAGGEPGAVSSIVSTRPELGRLDALSEQQRAARSAARAQLRPQAAAVVQYGLDANQVSIDQRGYAAYVNLSVPVFDWFRSRGLSRQASYREEQIRLQREESERAFARDYLRAKASTRSWFERMPIAQRAADAAQQNLRLTRLLYESGEGLMLDVVTAQSQATDAGRAYYAAVAQYERSLIELEVASGR
jgi:outer membrane protein TolC